MTKRALNRREFFGAAEDMVKHIYAEQGYLHPMALALENGSIAMISIGEARDDTDSAERLATQLKLKQWPAYAVAFEASLVGSQKEVEARQRGEVQLDQVGPQRATLADLIQDAGQDFSEFPSEMVFLFMASLQGPQKAVGYPVVEVNGQRQLGPKQKLSQEMESPFRNLYSFV
ncbi:hypothetical protein [Microvirga sp. VF16]|uniref:hypothetical protein n=1 Tax=Microvirga sp. VF16 TaxID=2807101 RepID=UPI00193E6967|nr:hypothetical protein [Microvirga sp. VF16]QRM35121.1 hypothetical protein JO965_39675 [Microvirga sp. VF16]